MSLIDSIIIWPNLVLPYVSFSVMSMLCFHSGVIHFKNVKNNTVFLFSILGMGAGPSELGKLAREKWKLGKVETCLKAFKYSNHILRHCKIEIPFKRLV